MTSTNFEFRIRKLYEKKNCAKNYLCKISQKVKIVKGEMDFNKSF